MGIDLRTAGARLRLRSDTSEPDLVSFAKEWLLDGFDATHVNETRIRTAGTLEQLCAAFTQLVVRDHTGAVVSCFGYDDRYNRPEALWAALATGVTDDSWIAYSNDLHTMLATFTGGTLTIDKFDDAGWRREALRYDHPELETPASDDPSADLTALVRQVTGRTALGDGYARPVTDYRQLHALLDAGLPWQLTPSGHPAH